MPEGSLNIRMTATDAVTPQLQALQNELRTLEGYIKKFGDTSTAIGRAYAASIETEIQSVRQLISAEEELAAAAERAAAARRALMEQALGPEIDRPIQSAAASARVLETSLSAAAAAEDHLREQAFAAATALNAQRAAMAGLVSARATMMGRGLAVPAAEMGAGLTLTQSAGFSKMVADLAGVKQGYLSAAESAAVFEREGLTVTERLMGMSAASVAAAAGMEKFGSASRTAAGGSNVLGLEMRHIVGGFDSLSRNQIGQLMSSIGSGMRDAGLGAGTLATGIGALAVVMGTEAVLRHAEAMGKWATETRAAASAAGMGLAPYSQLQGALALTGLKSTEADSAMRKLSENMGTAIADSSSKAAQGLRALGITQDMVAKNGNDVLGMLKLLADAWVNNADGATKSAAAEAIMGRGFEALIPLLEQGSAGIDRMMNKAKDLGITLNTETAASLEKTGQSVTELGQKIRGDGISAMEAWGPTIRTLVTILGGLIDQLHIATDAVGNFLSAMGGLLTTPVTSMMSGTRGFAPSEEYFDKLDRQLHPDKYVDRGGGLTGLDAAADTMRDRLSGKRVVPPMVKEGTAAQQARDEATAAGAQVMPGGLSPQAFHMKVTEAEIASLKKSLEANKDNATAVKAINEELNSKLIALHGEQASAAASAARKGAAEAKASARQSYEEFSQAERLKIQEAGTSSDKIKAIYDEWLSKVDTTYKAGLELVRKYVSERERIERESMQKVSHARVEELAEQQKMYKLRQEATQVTGAAERLATGKPESAASAASFRAEAAQVDAAMQEMVAALIKERDTYAEGSTEYKKASEEILQTIVTAKKEEVELYKKAAAEIKKQNQVFTEFFDKLGSTFESAMSSIIDAVIAPSKTIYKVGLTSITESNTKSQIAQAIGSLFKSAISEAGHTIMSAFGSMIAKALSGGASSSIGELLGNWLSKAFSSITGSSLGGALGGAAGSAPTVAAITAQTAALTAAQTATTTAIVGAITAGDTSIVTALAALVAKPSFLGTTFASGGIVPSAQGGMVSGGTGGTLAILHAQEMVLPSPISRGLQDMIARGQSGGANANLTYSPTVNTMSRGRGGTGMTRSEFGEMLNTHGTGMMSAARNMVRNGWRPAG